MTKIKGQNIRIAVTKGSDKVYFAASTTCSINLSADVEDASTKDDAINGVAWRTQEVTGKNWDFSAEMKLVNEAGTAGVDGFDLADMVGEVVDVEVNMMTGENNRTKSSGIYTGKAIITSWALSAPNRADATVSVNGTGQGALAKASAS